MSDVKRIEVSIEQAKQQKLEGEVMERLAKNPDFDLLVTKGYMEQEAIRLVHAKSDPTQQTAQDQYVLDCDIRGIGSLASYFGKIRQLGRLSANALEENEAELEIARVEAMSNDDDVLFDDFGDEV